MNLWYQFIHPITSHFRRESGHFLRGRFPGISNYLICDLGGSRHFWEKLNLNISPAHITVFNVSEGETGSIAHGTAGNIRVVLYDGYHIPVEDGAFDLLVCNSVMEHVPPVQRTALASEMRRVAKRVFCQTPAYEFPIEPHFIAPFIHWLPRWLGFQFAKISPWRLLARPTAATLRSYWWDTQLLTEREVRAIFPRAEVLTERFLGLVKSYYILEQSGNEVQKTVRILGTRGIPAAHGGFETFAEHLSLHLVAKGWRVVVYCHVEGGGPICTDVWRGVERVLIPVKQEGAIGTIVFDWLATAHAAKHKDLCLTLGYNTAVFCALLRLKGIPNLINMDGIEWSRAKWGPVAKAWLWFNDWVGCWLGNHLVADHPQIKTHLLSRVTGDKISTIPYGADRIDPSSVQPVQTLGLGLEPGRFWTVIARPTPENSLLEIIQGFSAQPRGMRLIVLGNYNWNNAYHRAVQAAASDEVRFVGAIYDKAIVQSLRVHSAGYVHGHQVGGTNPSLLEALGAGNAVVAHDNRFNRWVAGTSAMYFSGAAGVASCMDKLCDNPDKLESMRQEALIRFQEEFTWSHVLQQYEALLTRWQPEFASRATRLFLRSH